MKNAAFRRLIEEHNQQILEDDLGNRILIDDAGNPVLDKQGKPVIIPNELLDAVGASLGEPEAIDIDDSQAEQLNVLANMVKGLSEEDAKKQY